MRKSLPTVAEFDNVILSFIAANDKAGCEKYIIDLIKECGRPRIMGHRSDDAERKVAMFLLTHKVVIAKYIKETGWHELYGHEKLYYDELCKWNGVDKLPDYSGSYALAKVYLKIFES